MLSKKRQVQRVPSKVNLTRYNKGTQLGEGAFGKVFLYKYKLKDDQNPLEIAVKELNFSNKPIESRRVKDEIAILKRVKDNDNVIKVLDIDDFTEKNIIKIAMEKCDYDMKEMINHFKTSKMLIPEVDLQHIYDQITNGAAYLHDKGIIHRDIKPANILLKIRSPGTKFSNIKGITFKISDFGFSRELRFMSDTNAEASKSIVGNVKYSSPEVSKFRGFGDKIGNYDGKAADVFSIGAMFFELATFVIPFDERELVFKEKEEIDLDEKLGQVRQEGLRPFLKQFLEWDPNDRISLHTILQHQNKENLLLQTQSKFGQTHQSKKGRAKNHAVVVLVGPSGGGKTSTIINLIGHNNDIKDKNLSLTKGWLGVSKDSSETRVTAEFILNMKSLVKANESMINKMTLGIVDTPGLMDTDGDEQDARNLTCMQKFLDRHPHLAPDSGEPRKYPNIVLFVMRGDGDRDIGPQSVLARCIRLLLCNSLHLTDGKNLVVVLTRACKIPDDISEWEQSVRPKCEKIQKFIYQKTGWTVPIVPLDNKPPKSIRKEKEWTVFPDGTRQPKNLFLAINKVMKDREDLVGNLAVTEFFSRSSKDSKLQVTPPKEDTSTLVRATLEEKKDKMPMTDEEREFFEQIRRGQVNANVRPDSFDNFVPDCELPEPKDEEFTNEQEEEFDDCQEESIGDRIKQYIKLNTFSKGYSLKSKDFMTASILIGSHVYVQSEYKSTLAFSGQKNDAGHVPTDLVTLQVSVARLNNNFNFQRESFDPKFIKDLKATATKRFNATSDFVYNKYKSFFNKYGHGIVSNTICGGQVEISFIQNEEYGMTPSSTPHQLVEILQKLGMREIPDIQMYYKNGYKKVHDTGDEANLEFKGGDSSTHDEESCNNWKETLLTYPSLLIDKKHVMPFDEVVSHMIWLDKHEEMARNLKEAFEEAFAETRKDVGQKAEKQQKGWFRNLVGL